MVDAQTDAAPVYCLAVDNSQAVNLVMDHLYGLGHRRIAYLDARTQDALTTPGKPGGRWVDSSDTRERREAYLAAMQRLGLAQHQHVYAAMETDSLLPMEQAVREWRRQRQPPTAIVAYDVRQAVMLCEQFQQADIQVPRDVTIAGAAGVKGEGGTRTGLVTHAQVAFRDMGWRAVQALVDQASGKLAPGHCVQRIGSELVPGTTAGKPRAESTRPARTHGPGSAANGTASSEPVLSPTEGTMAPSLGTYSCTSLGSCECIPTRTT